jgi:glycosyltransferase involved in cell wall biosynthesis
MRVLATLGYFGRFGETDGIISTYSQLIPFFSRHNIKLDILCNGPEDAIETVDSGVQVISHRPRLKLPLDKERSIDPLLCLSYGGRLVMNRKYDLVQSSSPDPTGLAALQVARRQKLPFLALYHTAIEDYTRIRVGRKLGKTAGLMISHVMRRYLLWYYNQADLLLAPSEDTRKEISAWLSPKTDVLSRGIDTTRFHPRHRDRNDNRIRVLYVGRVAPEKNLALLDKIIAFRKDIDLMIVGGSPFLDEYRKTMPYATFLGQLQGKALQQAYASADIFAFPSHTDTLGNVVLEAMASGLPVVVTNTMGPKELVKHGNTGFIAKSDYEFEQYLDLLINNQGIRRCMGLAARRDMATRTWDQIFQKLLGYYDRLLAGCRLAQSLNTGVAVTPKFNVPQIPLT